MTVPAPAAYGFLPWVRSGLAALAKNPPAQNFVSVQVGFTVNTTATTPVAVRLFGPGQVTGIDPRAITRMEPAPGSVSFVARLSMDEWGIEQHDIEPLGPHRVEQIT